MDFDRDWTTFAVDAEVEAFGTHRLCVEHNRLRRQVERLQAQLHEERQGACDTAREAAMGAATLQVMRERRFGYWTVGSWER
jgi:hemerythrin-like domain-containing protein